MADADSVWSDGRLLCCWIRVAGAAVSHLWFDESQLPCPCRVTGKCVEDEEEEDATVDKRGIWWVEEDDEDDYDPRYDEDEPFRDFWDAGIPKPGM